MVRCLFTCRCGEGRGTAVWWEGVYLPVDMERAGGQQFGGKVSVYL